MPDLKSTLQQMGQNARSSALQLAQLTAEKKNQILVSMADALVADASLILEANETDWLAAESKGIQGSLLDRLRLNSDRVEAMAMGIRKVAQLPDPIGTVLDRWTHPKGFGIEKIRVPLGVIGIIYESRPNVTSDAAVLCLKSGNATILRGGSEAFHSNNAIINAIMKGGVSAGLPENAIQLVPSTDRSGVPILARMDRFIDLIIPRGGKGLIETVVENARVPVIKHYEGICHVYVSALANIEMAVALTDDAKTQKPSVCNAAETILVHKDVAETFLKSLSDVWQNKAVEIRGDSRTQTILGESVVPACSEDWTTEYLDLTVSIKVVGSLDEAIQHINEFGSQHSDCIVTESKQEAEAFLRGVDSACVYHNVSTRFSDGEEFGFGAEIGISTDKLHARGPMGLAELTSYQYRVRGEGQRKQG